MYSLSSIFELQTKENFGVGEKQSIYRKTFICLNAIQARQSLETWFVVSSKAIGLHLWSSL
jgi:hypothetical protein